MTRGELETLVANYLHRTDLVGDIPGFITLATSRLGRELRTQWNEYYLDPFTVLEQMQELPAGFRQMRRLSYPAARGPVTLVSQGSHLIDRFRNRFDNAGGIPAAYALVGATVQIEPFLAGDYRLNYWGNPAELAASGSTNLILDNFPYLYLYACLVEAYIFTQDDAMVEKTLDVLNSEVDAVNIEAKRTRIGDAPAMRSA